MTVLSRRPGLPSRLLMRSITHLLNTHITARI